MGRLIVRPCDSFGLLLFEIHHFRIKPFFFVPDFVVEHVLSVFCMMPLAILWGDCEDCTNVSTQKLGCSRMRAICSLYSTWWFYGAWFSPSDLPSPVTSWLFKVCRMNKGHECGKCKECGSGWWAAGVAGKCLVRGMSTLYEQKAMSCGVPVLLLLYVVLFSHSEPRLQNIFCV